MDRFHRGVEDIFEAYQLRDGFLLGRCDHFVRRALRDDASGVEDQHALAQGKDLLAAVGDVEDRNAMSLVPLPQVVDDFRFRGNVERGQRLIQKQHGRIGD